MGRTPRPATALLAAALTAALLALPASAPATSGAVRAAKAPPAQLVPVGSVTSNGATAIRYQQQVGGVDVLDAQAVASVVPGTAPNLVSDSTVRDVSAPPAAAVSRQAAIATASAHVGVVRRDGRPHAALAVAPKEGNALVWDVTVPSLRPLGDYEVLVDATSGAVLSQRNRIKSFKQGRAKLYVPNPVVEHGADTKLADSADSNSALLTSLRVPVTLERIVSGQHCLRGRWAEALLGPKHRPVCRRSLHFGGVKRSQDRFEALEAYYAIDRSETYIRSLGFRNIQNRRQVLRVDAIRDDNSFYLPSNRTITYGTGGVDDAEDADVIWHEYGHAIQDNQVRGFGTNHSSQSMGEGFGDYWSAAMTASVSGTTNTDAVCIFDWDGTTWGSFRSNLGRKCGRIADDPRTLLQAELNVSCESDVHCLGQIWSSALWDLHQQLGDDGQGRSIMDRVVLQSQFLLTKNASFSQAAHDLYCADDALYPQGNPNDCNGQHYSEIHQEMLSRKLVSS